MPDKDKSGINLSQIRKLEKLANDSMNGLYQDIKYNSPDISNTIEYMRNKMHRSIDRLVSNNVSNVGLTNISALYLRTLDNAQKDRSIIDGIHDTFENESLMNNVMNIYSQNVNVRQLDREIEMVCKYMPKLVEALETRKEHVLSADHFSKDSINIKNSSTTDTDVSAINNIKEMKEKYEVSELMSNIYDEIDYRGEAFVYIVPYKKAIAKLMDKRNTINQIGVQNESFNFTYDKENNEMLTKHVTGLNISEGFTVEIDKSGLIDSAILEYQKVDAIFKENANLALNESVSSIMKKKLLAETKIEEAKKLEEEKGKLVKDDIQEKFYKLDPTSQDGLITSNKTTTSDIELKVPGCVVKILEHSMVKPLYISDTCIGYFYIECDKEMDLEQTTFSSTLGGIRPGGSKGLSSLQNDETNVVLKKIASQISTHIDKQFVNANQDLTKEIYMILKYNSDVSIDGKINKIKVTFIHPEDMVHAYFKKDPKTNRGISGLQRALFPAKLYSCLYISNTLTILTRGQDKRIYYIKQSVDTNIAGVLLNTINQIKRSNFGLRQIESMENIINVTGRFNDMIVPRSPSGEAPVDVEVMQGQNVEIKTELMNMLEEMAVNSTDVPLEVIQARQQLDYATHYTMSNTKFLRKTYNRQSLFKRICDKVLTKIYNAEFECEDIIDTTLPPPMYLNLVNTGQLFDQTNQLAQNVVDMYVGDEEQDVQAGVSREVKKYFLQSFLPIDEIMRRIEYVKMEAAKKRNNDQQQ